MGCHPTASMQPKRWQSSIASACASKNAANVLQLLESAE
jgi:hypothetical protein